MSNKPLSVHTPVITTEHTTPLMQDTGSMTIKCESLVIGNFKGYLCTGLLVMVIFRLVCPEVSYKKKK